MSMCPRWTELALTSTPDAPISRARHLTRNVTTPILLNVGYVQCGLRTSRSYRDYNMGKNLNDEVRSME